MSCKIIDGKSISLEIKKEVKDEVRLLREKNIIPTLAVVLVGQDMASQIYVRNKKRACEETDIKSISYELPDTTTEEELLDLINDLNNDEKISGILIQLPLPKQIDSRNILSKIKPSKDVDGFSPYNVGLLETKSECFKPCTPAGIVELLKRSNVKIESANCVVIGRSNIVGKPVATLLLAENGTVTITHSKTKNIEEITRQADILVVCIGSANFVTKDMIKEGAVIIDVGMNRIDGKLCGDVDFESCKDKAGYMTPVPGGVGPMTIAMLMKNTSLAAKCKS